MRSRDPFSELHPATDLIFLIFVIFFTMFFMHPAALTISFICSLSYAALLKGRKLLCILVAITIPVMIFSSAINVAFNHSGVTVLTYFPTGNALTLESLLYGSSASIMLASIMGWFVCWNEVMESDKIMHLTGRLAPALSLVISMTFRFVPLFIRRFGEVKETQRCIGRLDENNNITGRIRNGVSILSIMLTWSLENAVVTYESMRSRGYGLPGRTSYTLFRMGKNDWLVIVWTLICVIAVAAGWKNKCFKCEFFPVFEPGDTEPIDISVWCVYFAFCITPSAMRLFEDIKWRKLK